MIDPYFIEFSVRLTTALDRAGFPLCRGHVMATNPVWRKTLEQWQAQVGRWAWQRSGQAVLSADIFLDFRPVYGDASLATRLRDEVLGIAAANPAFVRRYPGRRRAKPRHSACSGRSCPTTTRSAST